MKKTVFAFDDGFGENKLTNGQDTFVIPSQYTTYKPRPNDDFNTGNDDPHDFISIEINGEKYVVGKGAEEINSNLEWVGGNNKHLDIGFPIILKSCLSLLAKESHTNIDKLVMGLPVRAYKDQNRHNQLERLVKEKHFVKVELANGETFTREITVKDLVIKMQPFGSLCDLILDKNGNMINKQMASEFNVIVDIGARTLNILTVDQLKEVPDLSTNTNDGMFSAYEKVGQYIEQKLKFPIPTGKLPSTIKKGKINNVDLSPVIKKSYEILASQIYTVLERMFVDHWAFVNNIIFTGGGAVVLQKELTKYFTDRKTIFMGQCNNVEGLRKYGTRLALKEKTNNIHSSTKVG